MNCYKVSVYISSDAASFDVQIGNLLRKHGLLSQAGGDDGDEGDEEEREDEEDEAGEDGGEGAADVAGMDEDEFRDIWARLSGAPGALSKVRMSAVAYVKAVTRICSHEVRLARGMVYLMRRPISLFVTGKL